MNHKIFVPVTDELLYEHPELITAPLRPYQADQPCLHWLAVEILPDDDSPPTRALGITPSPNSHTHKPTTSPHRR